MATRRLRIYVPLNGGLNKKITAARQELTGDWKGIPPHITLLEIDVNEGIIESCIDVIQKYTSEFISSEVFDLSDAPDDVRQFKIFTALRYNAPHIREIYEKTISLILEKCQLTPDEELIVTETASNIIFSTARHGMIYALPLYAKDLSLLKCHVSICITQKIKDVAASSEFIRERLGGIMKQLTSKNFTEVKVEIIESR